MEGTDICLNIEKHEGKRTSKLSRKLKNRKQITHKKKKNLFSKEKSCINLKTAHIGTNKRIKQKSLASIVANSLEKVNKGSTISKPGILKSSISHLNSEKSNLLQTPSKLLHASDTNEKRHLKTSLEKSAAEPNVSFIKTNKSNKIKTILARKRKQSTVGGKKSLVELFGNEEKDKNSNIFAKKDIAEDIKHETEIFKKKMKCNLGNTEVGLKKPKTNLEKITGIGNAELNSGLKSMDNFKNQKSLSFKPGHKEKSKNSSGKISSLFGNNPEIPNIGQRFVKPIDEKVFTATKFSELNIHPYTVSNLDQNMKIITMTTVQKKAIPVILSGKDVLIRSQTGSGKTLAYALPVVDTLQNIRPKLSRGSGINALVIVPTRELALQTYEWFLKLVKPFTWIVPGYLVGGEKRKAEKARLRKGCNILVATPGRLLDHIRHTQSLKLNSVKCFILDEADRMLDMGYEKDISEIVSTLKNASSQIQYDPLQLLRQNLQPKDCEEVENELQKNSEDSKEMQLEKNIVNSANGLEGNGQIENNNIDRQTILLSATLSKAVEKLAGLTMANPIFVDAAKENIENSCGNIADINEDLIVPESVIQSYIVTPPKLRLVTLSAYIVYRCQKHGNHKIIVFLATQDMVDYHTEVLSSVLSDPIDEEDEDSDPLVELEFFKLHGNMVQRERTDVFQSFKKAKSGVLFCTDVAARGLDLPKVDTVIQYTGPNSTRDYVHRIGRTARVGTSGTAVIFLTPSEIDFVRLLESRKIRIKQDDMEDILSNLLGPLSKHNTVHAAAVDLQNKYENLVIENKKVQAAACKAYLSWVRFYSSYPKEMREIFNRKDLHLGHYAKSFGLRDPPRKIGSNVIKQVPEYKHKNRLSVQRNADNIAKSQKKVENRHSSLKHVRMLNISEYDSGLEIIKKIKKS